MKDWLHNLTHVHLTLTNEELDSEVRYCYNRLTRSGEVIILVGDEIIIYENAKVNDVLMFLREEGLI